MSPEEEKRLVDKMNRFSESPELQPHDERDMDKLQYVMVERRKFPKKGKWLRFSEENIKQALDHKQKKPKKKLRDADPPA